MPISGLVVTLTGDAPARTAVLARLAGDPRVETGIASGNQLPIVTDTQSPEEAETLVRELLAVPGVFAVDVVCIDLSLDSSERACEIGEAEQETHGTT